MVTRGDVSLDVEDNRGPNDWPQISDISQDMLRYSVHLPLEPKVGSDCPLEVKRTSKHNMCLVLLSLL